MRKFLMLTAALLVPGVAFADGEEAMAKSGWFYGGSIGWTQMDMPEHANASININLVPSALQADVDGVSYAMGVGRDSEGGWRTLVFGSFFTGDGSASSTTNFLAATTVRRGTLSGATQFNGVMGLDGSAHDVLSVNVDESTWGVSFGRALVDMVRADLVASYNYRDTAYRHAMTIDWTPALPNPTVGTENTDFETRTVEFAARLSAAFGLSEGVSVGLGGSVGYGMRDVEMVARQRLVINGGQVSNSSLLAGDEIDGMIYRLDASLGYALSPAMNVALTANYVSDSMVPEFVAPDYATVTPAGFTTDTQSTMTYGLRLVGRF
jgi:hypothetical protein